MTEVSGAEPQTAEGGSQFCHRCGNPTLAEDLFCRRCGASLGETQESIADSGGARRFGVLRRKRVLIPLAAAAVVLLAAGVTVAAVVAMDDDSPSAAERTQARQDALRARLSGDFDTSMQTRARFFTAERQYLTAMADARTSIRNYQRRLAAVQAEIKQIDRASQAQYELCRTYVDVDCPNPTYPSGPDVPDLSSNITKLRSSARLLAQIRADLLTVDPEPELRVLHAQLLAATEALSSDATHNADVLTEAVATDEVEGGQFVNTSKIRTLRGETALPAIRQMNKASLELLRLMGLRAAAFDVPGGNDLDTSDHSTAR